MAAPGLSADAAADAACGLGECLQKKGEAILAAADREVAAGPDTQPAASAAACAAFEGAVAAYARVPGPVHAPLGGGGRHPALALRPDEEERRGEAAGMVQAEPRIVLGVGQQIGERLELRLRLGREPQGPKGGWLAEVEVARARAMALR